MMFEISVNTLRLRRKPLNVLSRKKCSDIYFAPMIYTAVHDKSMSPSKHLTTCEPQRQSTMRLVNHEEDFWLNISFAHQFDIKGQHFQEGNKIFILGSMRAAMALPSGDASFKLNMRRINGAVINSGLVVIRKFKRSFIIRSVSTEMRTSSSIEWTP